MRESDAAPGPGRKMRSPWAETLDRDRPHPGYPRPSPARDDWLCLNGTWEYAIRPRGERPSGFDGSILVPFPLESELSGVAHRLGPESALWYRRQIEVPPAWAGSRILVHFEAADWETKAWLDGKELGSHRGGFTPFAFELPPGTRDRSELLVEVRDPTDSAWQCRGKQSLRPRGIWYTASSGIWASVWLEPLSALSISAIHAMGDPESGLLPLGIELSGPPGKATLHVRLKDGDSIAAEASGPAGKPLELRVPSPKPWSPGSPFLYGLEVELSGGDRVHSYVAFRSFGREADGRGGSRLRPLRIQGNHLPRPRAFLGRQASIRLREGLRRRGPRAPLRDPGLGAEGTPDKGPFRFGLYPAHRRGNRAQRPPLLRPQDGQGRRREDKGGQPLGIGSGHRDSPGWWPRAPWPSRRPSSSTAS